MTAEKVLENRLRRVAARQGLTLNKSRRKDTRAMDFGGYMLSHTEKNAVVYGGSPFAFSASLEDVARFLKEPVPADRNRR